MPLKKTNRNYKNKSKMPLSASQVKAIEKIATRSVMRRSETKFKATELDAQAIGPDDACYIFDNISDIAQGIDNEQRIGDRLLGTGLQLKYMFESDNINGVNYLVRMVLLSAEFDEFDATTDEFLVNSSNEPLACTGNDNMDVLRSLNRKGYKVLWDKNLSIQGVSSSGGNVPGVRYGTKFFKFKHNRLFDKDTATDSQDNNLRLLVIVRDAGGATIAADQDIKLTINTRYYYKDF